MKIFEFHFNPKSKSNSFLKSVFYEPITQREQQLGNMYVIGELVNAIPKNAHFIQRISGIIKTHYYSSQSIIKIAKGNKIAVAEAILKEALKKVNELLNLEAKKGNIDWLGNLNVAICTLIPKSQDSQILNISKTGSVIILLARRGKFTDISQGIDKSEEDAVKLKEFSNIIAGEVIPKDKVFIITKELYNTLLKQKLLSDLAFISEEKQLKALFETKKKQLAGISGILFVLLVEELTIVPKKQKKSNISKRIPQISIPYLSSIPSFKVLPIQRLQQIRKSQLSVFNTLQLKRPTITAQKKTLLFGALFLVILITGFFLFKEDTSSEYRQASSNLKRAQALEVEATRALDKQQDARANALMQEAWKLVEPYSTSGTSIGLELAQFKQNLERELAPLNNIEFIEEPEIVLQLESDDQNMMFSNGILYFSNPFSSKLTIFNTITKELNEIDASRNLKFGTVIEEVPTYFAEPNIILFYKNNIWNERQLQFSSSDMEFQTFASFEKSLYTYDISSYEIIKYSSPLSISRTPAVGILWFSSQTKQKPTPHEGGNAIALDGNIWIVSGNSEIQRYFKGMYRETLSPTLFPFIVNIDEIFTKASIPNLYILDKKENRVIILTKFGDLVRQYMSPSLNAIEDMAVSKDGKTIFLLNEKKVYKIDTTTTLIQQ